MSSISYKKARKLFIQFIRDPGLRIPIISHGGDIFEETRSINECTIVCIFHCFRKILYYTTANDISSTFSAHHLQLADHKFIRINLNRPFVVSPDNPLEPESPDRSPVISNPIINSTDTSENPQSLTTNMTTIDQVEIQVSTGSGSDRFGKASNRDYVNLWLASNPVFGKLIFPKLDIQPFSGSFNAKYVAQMIHLVCKMRMVHHSVGNVQKNGLAIAMAELHGAYLENIALPIEQARTEFRSIISAWIKSPDTFAAAGIAAPLITIGEDSNITDMIKLLYHQVTNEEGLTSALKGPVDIIVHSICAYAKRGQLNASFVDKVTNAIAEQVQKRITLDPEACSIFFSNYKTGINKDTAKKLFDHWSSIIPSSALKMQLVVQQAAGSGLTAYYTVCHAVSLYQSFPWHKVKALYLEEWMAFQAANEAIQGNPFYGFESDLKAVRSTKYKSIAWVAKELLCTYNGERGTLGRYQGWIKSPKEESIIQKIIEDYDKTRATEKANAVKAGTLDETTKREVESVVDAYQRLQVEDN